MNTPKAPVAVVMGSLSDWPAVKRSVEVLEELGLASEVSVMSAHRTPEAVRDFALGAEAAGVKVIIAAAGGAAHLAGVIAAHTILPVIGVPLASSPLNGFDALLSTVQMPSGVPVATVAVGSSGAANAAVLAAQILSLSDPHLRGRLAAYKQGLADKVQSANDDLRQRRGQ